MQSQGGGLSLFSGGVQQPELQPVGVGLGTRYSGLAQAAPAPSGTQISLMHAQQFVRDGTS